MKNIENYKLLHLWKQHLSQLCHMRLKSKTLKNEYIWLKKKQKQKQKPEVEEGKASSYTPSQHPWARELHGIEICSQNPRFWIVCGEWWFCLNVCLTVLRTERPCWFHSFYYFVPKTQVNSKKQKHGVVKPTNSLFSLSLIDYLFIYLFQFGLYMNDWISFSIFAFSQFSQTLFCFRFRLSLSLSLFLFGSVHAHPLLLDSLSLFGNLYCILEYSIIFANRFFFFFCWILGLFRPESRLLLYSWNLKDSLFFVCFLSLFFAIWVWPFFSASTKWPLRLK